MTFRIPRRTLFAARSLRRTLSPSLRLLTNAVIFGRHLTHMICASHTEPRKTGLSVPDRTTAWPVSAGMMFWDLYEKNIQHRQRAKQRKIEKTRTSFMSLEDSVSMHLEGEVDFEEPSPGGTSQVKSVVTVPKRRLPAPWDTGAEDSSRKRLETSIQILYPWTVEAVWSESL